MTLVNSLTSKNIASGEKVCILCNSSYS